MPREWSERVHESYRRTRMDGQTSLPVAGFIAALCPACSGEGPHKVLADKGDEVVARCGVCDERFAVPL